MTNPDTLLSCAASFSAQKRYCAILTILVFVANGGALGQEKRSFRTPDTLAGRWEAPDGHDGAVGMNIIITTHIDGAPASITGHVQYEDEFIAGLYQRTGPDVKPLDFNFFSSAAGGGMTWDGHQLTIHLLGKGDLPKVNVDLIWHEDSQTWSGLFERGSFSEQVSLKRPTSEASGSPFVGTWSDKGGIMNNCMHISQDKNGALTAWSDDIQTPGQMRYANGIQPPTQTMERYGEIAKANIDAPDRITVELRAYTAMCCSHSFTAKLSADGQSLAGNWLAGPNQVPRPVIWVRMPSNSCISSPSSETH
jgi:hypothetical protein